MGPLFFMFFVGIAFLVVLNIIIAIIADAYVEANNARKIVMDKKKRKREAEREDLHAKQREARLAREEERRISGESQSHPRLRLSAVSAVGSGVAGIALQGGSMGLSAAMSGMSTGMAQLSKVIPSHNDDAGDAHGGASLTAKVAPAPVEAASPAIIGARGQPTGQPPNASTQSLVLERPQTADDMCEEL